MTEPHSPSKDKVLRRLLLLGLCVVQCSRVAGKKPLLILEVTVFTILHLLPDGGSEKRAWPGWCGFFGVDTCVNACLNGYREIHMPSSDAKVR